MSRQEHRRRRPNQKVSDFQRRGDVVQLVRTLPCHGRGRGFESRRPRQFFQAFARNWRFRSWSNLVQLGQCLSLVEYQPYQFALRFPLLLHSSLGVQIEGDPTVCMAWKLLNYFHVLAVLSEQGRVRMPEGVKRNALLDLRGLDCRFPISSPESVWPDRLLPLLCGRSKTQSVSRLYELVSRNL